MRKSLFAATIAAAAAALIVGAALPASAADTTTTFALTAGSLSVSAPASVSLGSGAAGTSTITGSLGVVTVTDQRGVLVAGWTATVSSTDFTTGLASAAETVAKANVSYWSGAVTPTGVAVPVGGQPLAANAVTLAAARTAASLTAGTGNNTGAWNPTLIVTAPAASVVGTYTGTVTHSVA